jgi:K+-sensing histidine kinase KdpD
VIKGIVDKLGGKIEVESSTTGNTGTCFSIFLPTTKGNGTAVPKSDEAASAAISSEQTHQTG